MLNNILYKQAPHQLSLNAMLWEAVRTNTQKLKQKQTLYVTVIVIIVF